MDHFKNGNYTENCRDVNFNTSDRVFAPIFMNYKMNFGDSAICGLSLPAQPIHFIVEFNYFLSFIVLLRFNFLSKLNQNAITELISDQRIINNPGRKNVWAVHF
jgi:hypothetical protein